MLFQEEIEEIVHKIVATYGPDKILVFGSYAKGNPTDRSDLDLLVIKNSELPQQLRGQNVRRLFYGCRSPKLEPAKNGDVFGVAALNL